jgi:hypothetical protein
MYMYDEFLYLVFPALTSVCTFLRLSRQLPRRTRERVNR